MSIPTKQKELGMNSKTATKAYIEARKALEIAEAIKKQAEAEMKKALATEGVNFSIVDGVKVTVVQGERPNYDAEILRGLVDEATYSTVTKTAVDGSKMKSAIKVGMVSAEVAEAITTVTYYEQVRVVELVSEEVADATKASKVA
jgi:hypothetical protein